MRITYKHKDYEVKEILQMEWQLSRWWMASIILLFPSAIFWLSTLIYATMGTDYLIDVVITTMTEQLWGGGFLILVVLGGGIGGVFLTVSHFVVSKKFRWIYTTTAALAISVGLGLVLRII